MLRQTGFAEYCLAYLAMTSCLLSNRQTHQCALGIGNIVGFQLSLLSYRVLMPDTVPAPTKSERANRTRLVDRFNELVGAPHPAVRSMQLRFITGELTEQEDWEFRVLYEGAVDEIEVATRTYPSQQRVDIQE